MAHPSPPGRTSLASAFSWLTGEAPAAGNTAQQELMDMASRLSFSIRLSDWQDARPDQSAMVALAADVAAMLSQQGDSGIGLDTQALMAQMSAPQVEAEGPSPGLPEVDAAEAESLPPTIRKGAPDALWFS